ncbi:MAG: YceI family protein [Flavobacteriaceae bacterium]|nr:YceI family protein [Flavobacteriaceae bacterium]
MKKLNAFLLLNFIILSISAQETTMTIDTETSSLNWIGKKITNSQHNGSLKFISGDLTMCTDKKTLKTHVCKGNFIVDMTTLLVEDLTGSSKQKLEGHLKSDDFFSVDKHKKAFLSINSSETIESGFSVKGSLTIKNITHPVEFELNRNAGGFTAYMIFDRSKYNVKYNSGSFFENLGDRLILDDIELSADLYFQ